MADSTAGRPHRAAVRLSDAEAAALKRNAAALGVRPSAYMRLLLQVPCMVDPLGATGGCGGGAGAILLFDTASWEAARADIRRASEALSAIERHFDGTGGRGGVGFAGAREIEQARAEIAAARILLKGCYEALSEMRGKATVMR